MRRIAEEAGFSLGLAYHYVDDKDDLFGAVLERIGERLSAQARSHSEGRETLSALWQALEATPAFAPLMTSLVLEGRNVSEMMARHPVVADLAADAADRRAPDPALLAAMHAFLAISVQTYEVLMNRTMGREDDDERLRAAVADMFSAWIETQYDDH